jgi:hypothetical protein
MIARTFRVWGSRLAVVLLLCLLVPSSAFAQGGVEGLGDVTNDFFASVQDVLQAVALTVAVVSLLTLGMIYMLSTWPPVAQFKQQNPDMMQNIIVGLVIILFVSGGSLAGLITF